MIVAFCLSACENKFSSMPDSELRMKHAECGYMKNPQPGQAMACQNIEREMKRRKL